VCIGCKKKNKKKIIGAEKVAECLDGCLDGWMDGWMD
jgi:hypothetical protein